MFRTLYHANAFTARLPLQPPGPRARQPCIDEWLLDVALDEVRDDDRADEDPSFSLTSGDDLVSAEESAAYSLDDDDGAEILIGGMGDDDW